MAAFIIETKIPRQFFYFDSFAVATRAEAIAAVADRAGEVAAHLTARRPDLRPEFAYTDDRLSCHILPSLDLSTYDPSSHVAAIEYANIDADTYNATQESARDDD